MRVVAWGVSAKQSCAVSPQQHRLRRFHTARREVPARGQRLRCKSKHSRSEVQEAGSETDTGSYQLQESTQELHQGVAPVPHPHTPPQRHGPSQPAAFALGIALFGAAIWSLVTVWKRRDSKLHHTSQRVKHASQPVKQVPATHINRSSDDSSTASSTISSSTSGSTSKSSNKRKSNEGKDKEKEAMTPEELAAVRSRIICRSFARTGTCRFGDNCRYVHVRDPEPSQPQAKPQPIAAAPVKQSEAASQNGSSKPEEKEVKHDPYKPDPKATYTEHGTYRVPEDQIDNIGALMGYRGARIKGICYVSKAEIMVPREREPGLPVNIDVHANSAESIAHALRLIAEVFDNAEVKTAPKETKWTTSSSD